MENWGDEGYKSVLTDVLENGILDNEERTGMGTLSTIGTMVKYDLSERFPALTLRRVYPRLAFEETRFFISGETDTNLLEEKGVNFWKKNTSREFLDNRKLYDLPVGDMGKGYGYQWRGFNDEIDQLERTISELKSNGSSRRALITAWNPAQLDEMALPPCHIIQHYLIKDGKLNCTLFMRSNDLPFGAPYNVMSYALTTHFLSKILDVEPGILVHQNSDSHIYLNQIPMVEEMITRSPVEDNCELIIRPEIKNIDDILDLKWDDEIFIKNYNPHPDVEDKPPMNI